MSESRRVSYRLPRPRVRPADARSVFFVVTCLAHGGAETQLVRIALGLRGRGWKVVLASILEPLAPDLVDVLRDGGVDFFCVEGRRSPDRNAGHTVARKLRVITLVPRLVSELRNRRPAAVVSFLFHANALASLGGVLAGVPVVVNSVRGMNFGSRHRRLVIGLASHMCDAVTTNARVTAKRLVAEQLVRGREIHVIANGFEPSKYAGTRERRREARAALGMNENAFLWLAVGRVNQDKDYASLLGAIARIAQLRTDARLCIAGSHRPPQGPLGAELEAMAAKRGISDVVRFLGLRHDVPDLLAAADAFVLSSSSEGLPNVVMEAMAAAKVVVATDVGGVRELVEDGETGIVVPARDPHRLADAMLEVMSMEEGTRVELGQRAAASMSCRFSIDALVTAWESLLVKLLKEAGVKARSSPAST